MYQELVDKKVKLAVIGLGYVGLPIALAFAKKISVIGFDINPKRIDLMRQGVDPSNELVKSDFDNADIVFTDSLDVLREAQFLLWPFQHQWMNIMCLTLFRCKKLQKRSGR